MTVGGWEYATLPAIMVSTNLIQQVRQETVITTKPKHVLYTWDLLSSLHGYTYLSYTLVVNTRFPQLEGKGGQGQRTKHSLQSI